jgi:hypothetical protein
VFAAEYRVLVLGVLYSGQCMHRSVVLLPGGLLGLDCPSANMHSSYLSLVNSGPLAAWHSQTDIMVRPPKQGEPSYELYCKERDGIIGVLQRCAFVYTAHWPGDCHWLLITPPSPGCDHLNVRYRDFAVKRWTEVGKCFWLFVNSNWMIHSVCCRLAQAARHDACGCI